MHFDHYPTSSHRTSANHPAQGRNIRDPRGAAPCSIAAENSAVRSQPSRARKSWNREALERSTKALGQRDGVLGPSTPMVRRGRYRAISSTSRAPGCPSACEGREPYNAGAASSAYNDIVLKYFKHSVSTDCQNPGTLLRCGAESLRTTTNLGSYRSPKINNPPRRRAAYRPKPEYLVSRNHENPPKSPLLQE